MVVTLNWLMLLLAIFAGTGLLFSRDWRWCLGLLAVQYLSVFWMVQAHWPITLAAKNSLRAGWPALFLALHNSMRNKNQKVTGCKEDYFTYLLPGWFWQLLLHCLYALIPGWG